MNQAHFELLKRRLASPSRKSSELLAKAQAARELSEARVFAQSTPEVRQRVRAVLERLLADCEEVGGWQCDRTASVVGRVLDAIEEDVLDPPEPEERGWREGDPFFELDLGWEMTRALGWIGKLTPERQAFIDREGDLILASENPVERANRG